MTLQLIVLTLLYSLCAFEANTFLTFGLDLKTRSQHNIKGRASLTTKLRGVACSLQKEGPAICMFAVRSIVDKPRKRFHQQGLLFVAVVLIVCASCSVVLAADNITTQRDILMDLFNSTMGLSWSSNGGWGSNEHECSWAFVVCNQHSNITALALDGKGLKGTVPESLGGLTSLQSLNLGSNELFGTLPERLSAISTLSTVHLSINNFNGTLPERWSGLINLIELHLSRSQLSGSLPSHWSSMKRLSYLSLGANRLTGTLPQSWGNLTSLTYLALEDNRIEGQLPPSWSQLTSLVTLYLSVNNLTGTLPPSFRLLRSVTQFLVGNNNLSGTLPAEWGDNGGLSHLNTLDLENNPFLSGPIPWSWKQSTTLIAAGAIVAACGTRLCGSASDLGLQAFICFPRDAIAEGSDSGSNNSIAGLIANGATFEFQLPCESGGGSTTTIAPPPPSTKRRFPSKNETVVLLPHLDQTQRSIGAITASSLAVSPSVSSTTWISVAQRSVTSMRLRQLCVVEASTFVTNVSDGADGSTSSVQQDQQQVGSSLADNPTQLQLPLSDSSLTYAGGTVVGNALLVLSIGVVLHVGATWMGPWLSKFKNGDNHQRRRSSPRTTKGRIASVSSSLIDAMIELLPVSTLPSCACAPYAVLLQPSITSAITLCIGGSGQSAPNIILGVVFLCAWLAPLGVWGWTVLWHWRPFLWKVEQCNHRSHSAGGRGRSRLPSWLMKALRWVEHTMVASEENEWTWVGGCGHPTAMTDGASRHHHDALESRWSALFTAYRDGRQWFVLVEWSTVIVGGIVSGAAMTAASSSSSADAACSAATWGGWLLVALSGVLLLLRLILHPMESMMDMAVAVLVDALGVAAQVAAALDADDVNYAVTMAINAVGASLVAAAVFYRIVSALMVARGMQPLRRRRCAPLDVQRKQPHNNQLPTVAPLVRPSTELGSSTNSFIHGSSRQIERVPSTLPPLHTRFEGGNVEPVTSAQLEALRVLVDSICAEQL